MCGIVGYAGKSKCLPVLIEGLKMLEYRGYDSAGVAFFQDGGIQVVKTQGKLARLEERLNSLENDEASCGIAHTRWATHGAPSDVNSHPHSTSLVSIVHNGIIENYANIEEMLSKEGYSFVSDTDTERAAKLIDLLYRKSRNPISALFDAAELLCGSYAFGVMFADIPGKIYAIRKDSPLIVAKSKEGAYLASDIPAILPYTKEYCRLDEHTVAELSGSEISFYDSTLQSISQRFEVASWTSEQAKKGGFPHFMLKEIYEEPSALEVTVQRRIQNDVPYFDTQFPSVEELKSVQDIHIVACGTAMHAGLVGKYIIEKLCRIPVNVEIASEFRYRDPILRENSLVILLSQSGETADTLAALRHAKKAGVQTLAIVNVFGSSLAREADHVLYTMAGPEISVASTKAYSVQCAMLYLFATHLALIHGKLSEDDAKKICKSMSTELPRAVAATLALNDKIRAISTKISSSEHIFYIGRGIDYHLCVEASLKLKEISYIHSEAYAAGELKHGTISLIEEGIPVICVMTDPVLAKKTESGIREVASRGAEVIVFCSEEAAKECALSENIEKIVLPCTNQIIYPFLVATAVQLLAYHTSAQKGLDVDKPRNLAKSVTVE